jgi:hypothetical protein
MKLKYLAISAPDEARKTMQSLMREEYVNTGHNALFPTKADAPRRTWLAMPTLRDLRSFAPHIERQLPMKLMRDELFSDRTKASTMSFGVFV